MVLLAVRALICYEWVLKRSAGKVSFWDRKGTKSSKTDEVGRVEGTGLVYISGGGRSAISSSCRVRNRERQPQARPCWRCHCLGSGRIASHPMAFWWARIAAVPGRGEF